jgi:hypothetical protein
MGSIWDKEIKISKQTQYELKQVKEVFGKLKINNEDDAIIGYALRLVLSINNTKLPIE